MLQKILDKYLREGIMQYFMNAGSGVADATDIINNSNVYNSTTYADADGEYVYAIEMYTDGVTFTTLEEGATSVGALRLSGGTNGYPQGAIITGKFNKITPAATHECGIFIKKSY